VNALRPARKPIRKSMFWFCRPWATPATAARTAPRMKATTMMRSTLMPIEAGGVGVLGDRLHAAAELGRLTKYQRRAAQMTRAPTVKIAARWMVSPPICSAGPVTTSMGGNGSLLLAPG
jgi:hypothetical protein